MKIICGLDGQPTSIEFDSEEERIKYNQEEHDKIQRHIEQRRASFLEKGVDHDEYEDYLWLEAYGKDGPRRDAWDNMRAAFHDSWSLEEYITKVDALLDEDDDTLFHLSKKIYRLGLNKLSAFSSYNAFSKPQ